MQAIKLTEGFQYLDESAQNLVKRLEQDQNELQKALTVKTESLLRGQAQTNALITAQHERTRDTILASILAAVQAKQGNEMHEDPGIQFSNVFHHRDAGGQEERDDLASNMVLQNLSYVSMTDRFEEIEAAHEETYEWIFKPAEDSEGPAWSDFSQWLASRGGIYWISGKAASGKSTLMKFICEDPRTTKLLKAWSGTKPPIIAKHFFWNSGQVPQRTYTGLLRGLLFQILKQLRHLIPQVVPDQWAILQDRSLAELKALGRFQKQNLNQTVRSFLALFRLVDEDQKFFFLIDGLDEYDSDPFDMINLVNQLSEYPNVKMVLSSRPLYEFVKAFKAFPSLRLQDLTFCDIKKYVDDELASNDQMLVLQKQEPDEAPKLVLEIIERADGVFLWVRLVVQSLLRGLRNLDRVSDLQRRLRLLPPRLEDLFIHVLERIEPVYQEQSSRIFQIFVAALALDRRLSALDLSFAEDPDPDHLIHHRTEAMTERELVARCELVEIWLSTRCGGLIEYHNSRSLSYLHRSVRDFLELPEVWLRLLNSTNKTEFNAHQSLLRSCTIAVKYANRDMFWEPTYAYMELERISHELIARGKEALKYAYYYEKATGKTELACLDEFHKCCVETINRAREAHPALTHLRRSFNFNKRPNKW